MNTLFIHHVFDFFYFNIIHFRLRINLRDKMSKTHMDFSTAHRSHERGLRKNSVVITNIEHVETMSFKKRSEKCFKIFC